jgi:methyl-accepting chemotaxis protein
VQEYFRAGIPDNSRRIDAIEKEFGKLVRDAQEGRLVNDVAERRRAYVAVRSAAFRAKERFNDGEVEQIVQQQLLPTLKAYEHAGRALALHERQRIAAASADIERKARWGLRLLPGLGLLALALGALLSWLITASITLPLRDALRVAEDVAAGKLGLQIDAAAGAEAGQLMAALQRMDDSLSRTVRRVRHGTDEVAKAAALIAAGNRDLSGRTAQQADFLQDTAASMEEVSATADRNAAGAFAASELAAGTSALAVQGGAAVAQLVERMDAIHQAASRVADINGVIDGIAFQTNILALNAAVEAARAGEQGRGFAVVAAEVRQLAQKSAGAAREIKALIGATVAQAAAGDCIAKETGAGMQRLVQDVAQVSSIMAEIAAATREQQVGMERIGGALARMDGLTRDNAALVEDAAAASIELKRQALELEASVGMFEIGAALQEAATPAPLVLLPA